MQMEMKNRKKERDLLCSFCGKLQSEVGLLIAGPGVYICNECIDLCIEHFIFDEHKEYLLPSINNLIKGRDKREETLAQLNIKPRFNTIQFSLKDRHCFYLCPFSEPFNNSFIFCIWSKIKLMMPN